MSYWRKVGRLAGLAVLIVLLASCGSQQNTRQRASSTATPAASATPAATATPAMTRVPYPWQMDQSSDPVLGVVWKPDDPAVKAEMEADFLVFWRWSGHEKPLHFPYAPDPAQIAWLSTAQYAGQLQAYVAAIQSSQQLITYQEVQPLPGGEPIQTLQTCTQDGLRCKLGYSFSSVVKTTYNSQTGALVAQTTQTNLGLVVILTQVYSQERQRWQIDALQLKEITIG